MKRVYIYFSNLLLIAATAVLLFSSCKDKPDEPAAPAFGKLYLHLHTNIDTNEVAAYGVDYTDASGRKLKLSLAQLYISGISIKNVNGSTVKLPNAYILKTLDEEVYLVGSVPAGNYNGISFNVGVDAAANAKDPSTVASGPLAVQNPPMWFGNTSKGYIFINLVGLADTTADHSGSTNMPFSFQVGSNSLLKPVTMPPKNFVVTANGTETIHITCDYAKLTDGLDLRTDNNTDTYTNNPLLAQQIAAKSTAMFSYEE